MELRPFVPPAVCEQIKASDVLGVAYLGQSCRAFGDARGGIAAIAGKTDGVTEGEAVKLMEKRVAVVGRMEHGTKYLSEASAFFTQDNLKRFRKWMLDHKDLHQFRQIQITEQRLTLTFVRYTNWMGEDQTDRYRIDIPQIDVPDLDHLMKVIGW